ncbi:MAG: hypothetical protein ACOYMZ_01745 [Minisyncoccia bacterium]
MKEDIKEMPLGKFSGLKISCRPYGFFRFITGKEQYFRIAKDDVLVKEVLSLTAKEVIEKFSERGAIGLDGDRSAAVSKALKHVRDKLVMIGFSPEEAPFIKGLYHTTNCSSKEEWKQRWVNEYGLGEEEATSLTTLLEKVHHDV